MYCIKCGVKLADTEAVCPLCGTVVYHPDLPRTPADPIYPKGRYPQKHVRSFALQIVLTGLVLLPIITVLLCDLQLNSAITWSGYVVGALVFGYVAAVLPSWFRKPNPVIFVPCGFAAGIAYIGYIAFATQGNWFFSFALPIAGAVCLIVSAVVTLLRYVRRGVYYILGGAMLAVGGLMPLMEWLINLTFEYERFIGWSFYPLAALAILGGLLIVLGIVRPAREAMKRKFFF